MPSQNDLSSASSTSTPAAQAPRARRSVSPQSFANAVQAIAQLLARYRRATVVAVSAVVLVLLGSWVTTVVMRSRAERVAEELAHGFAILDAVIDGAKGDAAAEAKTRLAANTQSDAKALSPAAKAHTKSEAATSAAKADPAIKKAEQAASQDADDTVDEADAEAANDDTDDVDVDDTEDERDKEALHFASARERDTAARSVFAAISDTWGQSGVGVLATFMAAELDAALGERASATQRYETLTRNLAVTDTLYFMAAERLAYAREDAGDIEGALAALAPLTGPARTFYGDAAGVMRARLYMKKQAPADARMALDDVERTFVGSNLQDELRVLRLQLAHKFNVPEFDAKRTISSDAAGAAGPAEDKSKGPRVAPAEPAKAP